MSQSTARILAKMIKTCQPYFTVRVANVAKQSGTRDCGVYAIAFITHIANGLDPSLYVFDQGKMREHLTKCFEKRKLETFPVCRKRRGNLSANIEEIYVYCYCRSIYGGERMVKCNGGCGEWYHKKCITAPIKDNKDWFCKNCS